MPSGLRLRLSQLLPKPPPLRFLLASSDAHFRWHEGCERTPQMHGADNGHASVHELSQEHMATIHVNLVNQLLNFCRKIDSFYINPHALQKCHQVDIV